MVVSSYRRLRSLLYVLRIKLTGLSGEDLLEDSRTEKD